MKSTSIVKQFFYCVEYAGLRFLSMLLGVIPGNFVYGFARILGLCAYHCVRIRRDVTMTNLRYALGGELSETELEKIAREAYINMGMTFGEMLLVPKLKNHILRIVDMSDEYIMTQNKEKGRGLILVSCHFGSWELNGASIAASGVPVTVVAKRQSNPYVDNFINRYRATYGVKIISTGAPLKDIIRALREREAVGLISDQDAGRNGVFVSFFGREASTPRGAAQLALKYGTPIVVTVTMRISPGRYKSIFKEVEIRDDDTVEILTQRFTTIMEEVVRQNPGQYFWMHRRWKTRPPVDTLQPGEYVSYSSGTGFSFRGE